ncbi:MULTISPECIES: cupin domain-containing protein [unclassified Microbacterium]|uniref:cupin domain-containing protein n=1 Tax=unclassified Microbacterium TaxID=2609290 RepID=UPI00364631A1
MADLKRYVIGRDENGKSSVLMEGVTNQQEDPGIMWRGTLWKTREIPVDNSIRGDRSLDGGAARAPFPGGMLVRSLELWPDQDEETMREHFARVNKLVGHQQEATEQEKKRNPSMHRTDTLDFITVLRGEVYLILDEEEILLKATDSVIIQGTNHGWSNRGTEPVLTIGCMIDALPLPEHDGSGQD